MVAKLETLLAVRDDGDPASKRLMVSVTAAFCSSSLRLSDLLGIVSSKGLLQLERPRN
jgi:hypothetical protein